MLIIIVLVFVGFISALAYNIYSIYLPFYETLKDIKEYNIAYYGALGSIERANLVLKFRKAGFEGTGGWIGSTNYGPSSDKKIDNFGFLSKFNNGTYWNITSRVKSIPSEGEGNIEESLRYTGPDFGGPSKNFNKLEYYSSLQIALFLDNCSDNYYNENCGNINPISDTIKMILRLPPKLKDSLGNLDENTDIDGNGISNDIIVNRTLFGAGGGVNYTILPTISVDYENNIINNDDTAIRESTINNITENSGFPNIIFGNTKNPIDGQTNPPQHNIIPLDHPFSGFNFTDIFSNSKNTYLKFSIINLMKTNDGNIYPFLEYKISPSSSSTFLSDRFFTIKGVGKVSKYNVEIILKRPIVKSTAASDFAIIF